MGRQNSALQEIGRQAKSCAPAMARATSDSKNSALKYVADYLLAERQSILEANEMDVLEARAAGLDAAMIDRLSLAGRIEGLAADVRHVAALPDPVGEVFDEQVLPNGLRLSKQRTPIGVLGVIYESRPNVTADVAALSIKTGNCVILRGGSETMHTNIVLVKIIQNALEAASLPKQAVQLVKDTDRQLVGELLKMHGYIDLIIPRGGAGLHRFCRENSAIPVITGGIGVCHLFVDESANLEKALEVIHNAKTQRPTVCNALDTLLVHAAIADTFIPMVIKRLSKDGVSFRIDPKAMYAQKLDNASYALEAGPDDWDTEWLSLVLGIKEVGGLAEAIQHIQAHSTGHSDGILTESAGHAKEFVANIDSAAVYVNASTRFTDGSQFGLGAEVAISTQKLHARGPMGLKELTSYKWVVLGDYHIRK